MSTAFFSSIVTLLLEHAAKPRGAGDYTFLRDGEAAAETLDYFELDQWARTIATELLRAADPSACVLLVHKPGLEFIKTFFGCLYAGMVPVPVAPPGVRNEHWQRVTRIAADSGASLVMSDLPEATLVERLTSARSDPLRFVAMPTHADSTPRFTPTPPTRESIALLQYSSGSTGQPKGVKVSHGNLIANQALICEKFEHSSGLVVVGWLPQYHDMGLIGNILQPLYLCGRAVLMSPASFLQRPYRWLKTIDTYGATTSGGPNFAFDLCVDRVNAEELESLDLSRWDLAFTGSEPIQARTIERFCERFRSRGFHRGAFYPCYGLAESTLMVSGGHKGAALRTLHVARDSLGHRVAKPCTPSEPRSVELVDCGEPGTGHEIRIVDPQARRPCAERAVGEIWVRGPSVALGYCADEALSGESFGATLAGGSNRYLRTGDLGFMERGRLFITGRLKDVIIIRGRNIHPQDVEQAAQSAIVVFRRGGGAAFSVPSVDGEQLVLVQEIGRVALRKADFATLAAEAREIVAAAFGIALHTLVLAKPGTVPTTSSGKVRRSECRRAFLDGSLISIHRSALDDGRSVEAVRAIEPTASESVAGTLREWIARRLRAPIERIEPTQSLVAQGLDSLGATELQATVLSRWGVTLDIAELLAGQLTLDECATRISSSNNAGPESAGTEPASSLDATHPDLSFNEEVFWRLQQLHWRLGAYAIGVPAILHGQVDLTALEHAVESVRESHPILRTAYPERNGQPVPQIQSITESAVTVIDATSWDAGRLSEWVNEIGSAPVNLAQGPLFRVHLLRLRVDQSLLHILIHHIAADLHSMLLITQQLAEAYAGKRLVAREQACSYREFARQQRAWVRSENGQASLRFWRNRLTELPGPLVLGGARSVRPASFSFLGFTSKFRIPPNLAGAIRAQVKSAGVTPFGYLLAAFQVLLFRRTGQQRFVVGSSVSQRDPPDFGSTVGCFVDVKWFQADVTSECSFREHLARVHSEVLEILTHRRIPMHLALGAAGARRSATVPFPNARFTFQQPRGLRGIEPLLLGWAGEKVTIGGLLLEAFPSEHQAVQADLSLTVVERDDDFLGNFTVCQDVFERRDADAWSRQFVALLEGVVSSEDASLAGLPLVRASEEPDSVIHGPQTDWRAVAAIHELFEMQARKTPGAIAIRWGDRCMGYRTLDDRANALGHLLLRKGIKRGDRVGLYMNRSADMVVGFLAVLKAGACCVMLDPSIPPGRRRFMADDARLRLLLVDRDDLGWVPLARFGTYDLRDVDLDASPASSLNVPVTEQDAVYLIYTSGSTGRPKGVIGVHRGIVNRTRWMLEHFSIGPGDGVLHTTPLNFVRAEREIFFPLCAGATLQILDAEGMHDPTTIVATLRRFESSFTASSPSLLRMMLDSASEGLNSLPHMRHWFIGADVLPPDLIHQLRRCRPDIQWTYFYGSTEVSSDVSCYTITAATRLESGTTPVGTPLSNVKLYILDEYLQPVPPGGIGILHVGGTHVSGGYWDDAVLTAKSFMPDPFSSMPGSRMYCTGDFASRREDGNLLVLGRNDEQVSVLGNRVELGEVARVVRGVPGIADAVVVFRVTAPDRQFLVAYVVESEPDARRRVWDSLADALPTYMLPAFIVPLDQIPLTALGKIDRGSLPPHDPLAHGPSRYIAPHTPLEQELVALWSELLGTTPEQIGIRHHFFEAGGNSLLVAQLHTRLRELLPSHPVRLADIYKYPSIRELARFLSNDASRIPVLGTDEHEGARGPAGRAQARRRALRAAARLRPQVQ